MEGHTLFNPGFLGGSFNWWVGQVSEDSFWRTNIIPTVHSSPDTNKGWGYRYKVRIIGLHKWGEEAIDSEDLPWAQVMYPITAGGGQGGSFATPGIRQGNMVFGFFMDQDEQQIPVIMGILGNNQRQPKSSSMADDRVTDNKPGHVGSTALGDGTKPKPYEGETKPVTPEFQLKQEKPQGDTAEDKQWASVCAPPIAGTQLNQFGLDPGQTLSSIPGGMDIAAEARTQAEADGLTGQAVEDAAMKAVGDYKAKQCAARNSPNAPSKGSAVLEAVDGVHTGTVDDKKKDTKGNVKFVKLSPCDPTGSAISGIQTLLDNLMNYIDGWLSTISSYIDAAASFIDSLADMETMLANIACEIAKYIKIIFDKIMEYVLKTLNKATVPAVAALPSTMRSMFGDVKDIITELICCLYNQMMENMCETIAGVLGDIFNLKDLEEEAIAAADSGSSSSAGSSSSDRTAPKVPMCCAETIVAEILIMNQSTIEESNNAIVQNLDTFIDDIQEEMAGLTDMWDDINASIGDITGSISGALSFQNLAMNILGCELSVSCPTNDYYTLGGGGSGQPDSEQVSAKAIENKVSEGPQQTAVAKKGTPFVAPTNAQQDVVP